MLGKAIVAAFALAAAAQIASAVVILMPMQKDPFAENGYCLSLRLPSEAAPAEAEPNSPDLIKWPDSDPLSLMTCSQSGYASLPNDFGPLSPQEKQKIAAYLRQANFGPRIDAEKKGPSDAFLAHLKKIYELRDKDEAFRAYFARYLASQYDDPKEVAAHRQTALALHLHLYKAGKLRGEPLLETLYALGYYAWRLSKQEPANTYFARLKATPVYAGTEQRYRDHLIDLMETVKRDETNGGAVVTLQPSRP